MAPKVSASMLFHPKKGANKETSSASPRKAITPRPKSILEAEVEEEFKLPEGPFQEFRLMSSALNGWKYDVMKFDSRKPVDISTWQAPIKLNRKETRKDDGAILSVPEAVGPMLGPDGKPVIGADGRMVMVDSEGRPIHSLDGAGGSGKDAKGKGAAPVANGRKKFQKKTRQVFYVPEEVRQLRREERYPWVMEDSSQSEVWVGKLEEVSKSETHAFFMPAANDVFKFVPAHRWYKFQKKPNHYVPTLEEAEKVLDKIKKNKDPQVWLLRNRNGKAPSAATAAIFKAESEGRTLSGSSSLVHSSGQSLGPGGRRLKAVDSGMNNLFGDDDEDGVDVKRRKEKEYGEEGDLDEQVYEEDFADDEEKMDVDDKEDEETKELEERLKREYKNANKQREGYVDESDEDDDDPQLTKDGKKMKKMIRNLEKNDVYDSDEDKNPYASSEEEEEEELPAVPPEPAIQQQPQQVDPTSGSQTLKPAIVRPQSTLKADSRATSPAPAPGLGGHSIVAKRATSPKVPKLKTNNGSRASSPLGGGSRPTSPVIGNRVTNPVANATTGSRTGSPAAQSPSNGTQKPSNKRKATDDLTPGSPLPTTPNVNGSGVPKMKKRKAHAAPLSVAPAGELEDRMVIDWLKNTPNATTRDCIQHFTPYLTDGEKKDKFTALVKEVAQLKGGVLVLRNAYRSTPSAPSPVATPAA